MESNTSSEILPIPPAELLRINDIAGMYYSCGKPTKTLLIYGIGAPNVPDNGNLPDAPFILKHTVDIFVPDYIGFGRSKGVFRPMNCIKTFIKLYDAFTQGTIGKNTYENDQKFLQYDRVIILGRSLGSTYVPILPRFDPRIKELAIFCPVVDSKSQGSIPGEETNELFLESMRHDGYHYLYRGVLNPIWEDHLENRDDLSPMDNMQYLNGVKLFIAHGQLDPVVHFSKSMTYYEKLCEQFPDQIQNFNLQLYPNGNHGPSTTNIAIEDFLTWIGL